ncbi:GH116 family glycosyl hydrolase [Aureibaculum luteum]|uniref:GH116 family glycosyl hydrolase n=1 Tax=Aureibaculum luteum TaxID=1548456 RepID=UPI000E4B948C|nr:GH116 family glycosyl hydrolase [Aureibaculum luteum]
MISWYFPNLSADGDRFKGRSYSNHFKNALEIGQEIAENFTNLHQKTASFVDMFYNKSTLPYWFLNRTFANTSTLATETCYLLEDGRFWAWEGIGYCPGTCTHVWHYAQAMGRVFPELERNLREQTDFSVIESNGKIDFRGGRANRDATDGQAGIVLRSYREHQMTVDNIFLKTNWKYIKSALQYLIDMDAEDGEANGMIYGEQHNTLDAEWYGNIPVITSLYLAALKAGQQMAIEMEDNSFSKMCTTILKKGKKNIETLYNGEYFVQNEDPKHEDAIGIGAGCYIDQVFGQSWAFQLGLGRLYNKEMIQNSLDALWKYNFVPNMGEFRKSLPESLAGRPYAIDDDAGLVMCTWPKGGKKSDWKKHWQFGYFNECMTGFEYEAAGHMVWEDKIKEGLAITRAIHDRYHAGKRNPYNEVECSDHYARAMASYGVYLAACGFEYHGPKKHLAFAPKLNPENFQAGFIAAEGWGTYTQTQSRNTLQVSIELASGNLGLKEVSLEIPNGKKLKKAVLHLNGKRVKNTCTTKASKVLIKFKALEVIENGKLIIEIKYMFT